MRTAKRYLFILLLILTIYKINGQPYFKKQIDFSVGAGLINNYSFLGKTPLITGSLAADYGLSDVISIGGFVTAFDAYNIYYSRTLIGGGTANAFWVSWNERHTWNMVIAGFRCAYHFNKIIKSNRIDLYSGIMVGNNFVDYTFIKGNPNSQDPISPNPNYSGGFIWSVYAGCRYKFNEIAGAYAELGYGITYVRLGLNCKLLRKQKAKSEN